MEKAWIGMLRATYEADHARVLLEFGSPLPMAVDKQQSVAKT